MIKLPIIGYGTWYVADEIETVTILKEAKNDLEFWIVYKDGELKLICFGGIHHFKKLI
jgi:hypothetical protein